ncbi:pseudouridine synthase [Gemella sanguinis]|uniref:pseudouridine synthase n=1 Tax=Gemella sanguinis TaxID=84135 RepID=UPI0008076114|nr:pseudouridine synthase [Gemella sanguinis]
MAERLQKLIAASGYTSRRKAEQLILDGKVTVNGTVVNQLGVKAEPSDIIIVEGVRLLKENKRYYLFYKPEKVITSMSDEKDRTCVKDFFESVNERVVPVGRLDYDTSGALIMSNDGEFINLITHPRHKIKKTYVAKISGKLDDIHLKILRSGVRIDNYKTAPAEVNIVKNKNKSSNTLVRLTIHEGKNRQIRRMFETLGYEVLKLKREAIEDLTLEGLKKGEYRVLTIHEVKRLINKANNGEK